MSTPCTAVLSDTGVAQGNGTFGVPPAQSQSQINSFRISSVVDGLFSHVSRPQKKDPKAFSDLCLSLSRGIDYAIAHHEFPSRAQDLPSLMKQLCQQKGDPRQLAAVLVLMISVKNACQRGWFPKSDCRELLSLGSEAAKEFGSAHGFNVEPPRSDSTIISAVISRFYPKMKINHMFAYLEVKAGFDAYLIDFVVEKDGKTPPASQISLFVVQTDNLETSSCLITPPKVNFLFNGHGVENRSSIFVDPGPQLPTIVTHLLRYGSNLLQAIGEFNGDYIIAVAIATDMQYPCSTGLKDYEQLAPATVDPDSEIIEGPSRVSINCPISFKLIKTPVKGHLCKHIQCFDYQNYMEMNSRRPSWRCPHCNQPVCFTDIRIDRKMVEILKGVGTSVSDIIISSDGSWSAATKSDDPIQNPEIPEPVNEPPQHMEVVDLDKSDDGPVYVDPSDPIDRKHVQTASQDHADDELWSTIYLSTLGQGTMSLPPLGHGAHAVIPQTNPVPLYPNLDSFTGYAQADAQQAITLASNSAVRMVNQPLNTLQLRQSHLVSSSTLNNYGRFSPVPWHVTGTPVSVPTPASAPISQQRQRAHLNSNTSNAVPVNCQVSASQPMISTPVVNANMFRTPPMPQHSHASPHMTQPQIVGLDPPTAEHQLSSQLMMTPVRPLGGPSSARPAPSMQPTTRSASFTHSSGVPRNAATGSGPSTAPQANLNPGDGVPTSDAVAPTDVNWQPTGRMRGAAVGQKYAEYFNRFMGMLPQQGQNASPVTPAAPRPFVADRAAAARTPGSSGAPHFSRATQPTYNPGSTGL